MWKYFSNLWEQKKIYFKLQHLLLDELGKVLMALGFGALYAQSLRNVAWILIILGLVIVLLLKFSILRKR